DVAISLMFLSLHQLVDRDDPNRALHFADESVVAAREQGEPWLVAMCLDAVGIASLWAGDRDRAAELLTESLSLLQAMGNRWLVTFPLLHLAYVAKSGGDYDGAASLGRECLALQTEIGDRWGITLSLKVLAAAAIRKEQLERGVRLLAGGEALLESLSAAHSEKVRPDYDRLVENVRETL